MTSIDKSDAIYRWHKTRFSQTEENVHDAFFHLLFVHEIMVKSQVETNW